MKLIILAVLAIIVAGHFMPVKKHSYSDDKNCQGLNHSYRMLLGQINRFEKAEASHKPYTFACDAGIATPKNSNDKLYLW